MTDKIHDSGSAARQEQQTGSSLRPIAWPSSGASPAATPPCAVRNVGRAASDESGFPDSNLGSPD
jgi:hypothetical protein